MNDHGLGRATLALVVVQLVIGACAMVEHLTRAAKRQSARWAALRGTLGGGVPQ